MNPTFNPSLFIHIFVVSKIATGCWLLATGNWQLAAGRPMTDDQ
jgi:hypothetical protein